MVFTVNARTWLKSNRCDKNTTSNIQTKTNQNKNIKSNTNIDCLWVSCSLHFIHYTNMCAIWFSAELQVAVSWTQKAVILWYRYLYFIASRPAEIAANKCPRSEQKVPFTLELEFCVLCSHHCLAIYSGLREFLVCESISCLRCVPIISKTAVTSIFCFSSSIECDAVISGISSNISEYFY